MKNMFIKLIALSSISSFSVMAIEPQNSRMEHIRCAIRDFQFIQPNYAVPTFTRLGALKLTLNEKENLSDAIGYISGALIFFCVMKACVADNVKVAINNSEAIKNIFRNLIPNNYLLVLLLSSSLLTIFASNKYDGSFEASKAFIASLCLLFNALHGN